jgi:hypothetical protein
MGNEMHCHTHRMFFIKFELSCHRSLLLKEDENSGNWTQLQEVEPKCVILKL